MDREQYIADCLSRGDAPVKREFIRKIPILEKANETVEETIATTEEAHSTAVDDGAEAGEKRPVDENAKALDEDKKKRRGQNKNHDRKQLQEEINRQRAEQLCMKFASVDQCEYGARCIHSHDVEKFLANRKPDLGEVCPLFTRFGACQHGLNCRFGSAHIKDGRNVNKDGEPVTNEMLQENLKENISSDLKLNLRKRTYDFKRADRIYKEANSICNTDRKVNDVNFSSVEKRDEELAAQGIDIASLQPAENEINHKLRALNQEILGGGAVVQTWEEEKAERRRKYDVKNKLILAPLTTVGNLPYRRLCVDLGVDATVAEMALATSILEGKPSEAALLKRHPSEKLFGVQIAGGFADTMTRVAQVVDEYVDCDFIDINSGCPIEGMNGRGAGCALMAKPHHMERMVRGMTAVSRKPVTVKIRMAYMERDFLARSYMHRLEEWGAAAVTLHGRTAKQRYTKAANWEYISSCKPELRRIPLVGDGDVMSWVECEEHFRLGQCDGVMIGRGALIKPWVFTEIKEQRDWDISSSERFDLIKKFANYGLEHWGSDTKGVETTRRFLLESLSFLHRYVPVGLLEQLPQRIHWRPPTMVCRDDMETRLQSSSVTDWMWIAERVLGPAPENFTFTPKHKSNSYAASVDEYYSTLAAHEMALSSTHEGKEQILAAAEAAQAINEDSELHE